MTDKELMQQALEALNRSDYLGWQFNIPIIKALRERLAQPEQEPVAWADMAVRGEDKGLSWTPGHFHKTPLYTAPPKQWVGLTDEEIDECERLATIRHQRHKYSVRGQIITPADGLEWHFAQAIEAKLKERNHG